MYCLDIKLLYKREKEQLGEQIKTMYIDGNNNATIKYQLFSLNVYVIQREFSDITISYNVLNSFQIVYNIHQSKTLYLRTKNKLIVA